MIMTLYMITSDPWRGLHMGTDQHRMQKLTKGLASKSEKMRALASAGYERADIARFLGTRYQFVRNVLVQDEERKSRQLHAVSAAAKSDGHVGPVKVRLGPD